VSGLGSLGSPFAKYIQIQWSDVYYRYFLHSEIITNLESDLDQFFSRNNPMKWLERSGRTRTTPNSRWVIQVLAGSCENSPTVTLQLQPLQSSTSDERDVAIKLYGAKWVYPWDDKPGLHQRSMPGGYLLRKISSSQDMLTIALKSNHFIVEIQGQGIGGAADQYGSLVLFYYLLMHGNQYVVGYPGTLINTICRNIDSFNPNDHFEPDAPHSSSSSSNSDSSTPTQPLDQGHPSDDSQGSGSTTLPSADSSLDRVNNAIAAYQSTSSPENVPNILDGIDIAIEEYMQAHPVFLCPDGLNHQPGNGDPIPLSGDGNSSSSVPRQQPLTDNQLRALYGSQTAYDQQKQKLIPQLVQYRRVLENYLQQKNMTLDGLDSGRIPAIDDLYRNFDLFMGTINYLTRRSFVVQDVAGDGSCGFWAIMVVMQHFILRDPNGCRNYRQRHQSNGTTAEQLGLWQQYPNWSTFNPMAGTMTSNLILMHPYNSNGSPNSEGNICWYEFNNPVIENNWSIKTMMKLREALAEGYTHTQYHVLDRDTGILPWLDTTDMQYMLSDMLQMPMLLIEENKAASQGFTINYNMLIPNTSNEDPLFDTFFSTFDESKRFLDFIKILKQRPYIAMIYLENHAHFDPQLRIVGGSANHYKAIVDLGLGVQP
jgi:hypothetical protein